MSLKFFLNKIKDLLDNVYKNFIYNTSDVIEVKQENV